MKSLCMLVSFLVIACAGCCEQIQEEARDLRDNASACEAGETCVMTGFNDSCLVGLLCTFAVNEKKLSSFRKKANRLIDRFEHCQQCAEADCASWNEPEAFCNEETGECEIRDLAPYPYEE